MKVRHTAMATVVVAAGVAVLSVAASVMADEPGKGAPEEKKPAAAAAAVEVAKPAAAAEVAKPSAADVDMAAMNVLDRLEAADKDLRSLSAKIQYVRQFPEIQGGGSHTWRGDLKFQNEVKDGKTTRRFAVDFREMIVDGKKRDERQTYVFDGQWLLTANWAEKQYSRYELVRDGEGQDPMKLGEGPLPLPIGQRKAEMVERFVVSLPGVLEGVDEGEEMAGLRKVLQETVQIKLTPREGTKEAKDFREIRVWYRSADWLPIFAESVNTDETKAQVLLVDLKRNVEVGAKDFSTKAEEGWTGESRRRPGAEAVPAKVPVGGGGGVKKPA